MFTRSLSLLRLKKPHRMACPPLFLMLIAAGCRNGKEPQPADATPAVAQESPAVPAAPQDLAPVTIDSADTDRWLFSEQVADGAKGGWVTGSFDPQRNKLEIQTKDIHEFSIDTSRIPINWQRLVVISIDGFNSELKRRNADVLHFRLDEHKRWVVREP